ncbi:MAG: hypothetical protein V1744_01835 [Candidatus Altiarchaeota archaeon]
MMPREKKAQKGRKDEAALIDERVGELRKVLTDENVGRIAERDCLLKKSNLKAFIDGTLWSGGVKRREDIILGSCDLGNGFSMEMSRSSLSNPQCFAYFNLKDGEQAVGDLTLILDHDINPGFMGWDMHVQTYDPYKTAGVADFMRRVAERLCLKCDVRYLTARAEHPATLVNFAKNGYCFVSNTEAVIGKHGLPRLETIQRRDIDQVIIDAGDLPNPDMRRSFYERKLPGLMYTPYERDGKEGTIWDAVLLAKQFLEPRKIPDFDENLVRQDEEVTYGEYLKRKNRSADKRRPL